MSEKLSFKIQVLLTKSDIDALNKIVSLLAIKRRVKPISISKFSRTLIREGIERIYADMKKEQESYVKNDIDELLNKK